MTSSVLIALVLIGVLSFAAQWLAWGLRLPAILPLLLLGIVLGPATGVLAPDALFGDLLFPFVSLSVAVILFEGALTLRLDDIREHGIVVRNLVSIGLLVTFAVIAAATAWLLHLPAEIAALIGAVTVVTGPTVISPLLRAVRPVERVDRVLRWEGIIIDPIGAIFAVLVFEFILSSRHAGVVLQSALTLGGIVLTGIALGLAGGWLYSQAVKRSWLPPLLQNFGMLITVMAIYAAANAVEDESGLLAVTVMGIWLANVGGLDLEDVAEFKENLSVILLSAVFVLLAARLDIGELLGFGWPLLGLLAIVQFVARPLSVLLCTAGQGMGWRERLLLGWIAPRGIVAAAVSSLFAIALARQGVASADAIVPVVFAVILGTVIFQSLTGRWIATLLGLRRSRPNKVLIIGANQLGRELGAALTKLEIPVLMVDPVWEHYRLARMESLPSYYGVAQSEHAERVIDPASVDVVLALSPNRHQNAIAVYHFGHLLGEERVFAIRSSRTQTGSHHESAQYRRRQVLFAEDASFHKLSSLLAQGAVVKTTRIGDGFSRDDWRQQYPDAIPLLLVAGDRARPFTTDMEIPQGEPCSVVALVGQEQRGQAPAGGSGSSIAERLPA